MAVCKEYKKQALWKYGNEEFSANVCRCHQLMDGNVICTEVVLEKPDSLLFNCFSCTNVPAGVVCNVNGGTWGSELVRGRLRFVLLNGFFFFLPFFLCSCR